MWDTNNIRRTFEEINTINYVDNKTLPSPASRVPGVGRKQQPSHPASNIDPYDTQVPTDTAPHIYLSIKALTYPSKHI